MTVSNANYEYFAGKGHLSADAGAESGDGGGAMDVWGEGRFAIINSVARGTFTDESSFGVPAAVVNSSNNPYETPQQDFEKFMGVNAQGSISTSDGNAMPGTATITRSGQVVATVDSEGLFIVSASPPTGVTLGAEVPLETYTFIYDIDLDGLSTVESDFGTSVDIGSVTYGDLSGKVTDYNGDPVPNVGVDASDGSAKTDSNGEYTFNAPGGTDVTVTAVGVSKTRSVAEGASTTVDFQYAGLQVTVQLPNGDPVTGATVETDLADDSPGDTGESGTVQFVRALASTAGTVTALGGIERDVTTNGEGVNFIENIGMGVGFSGSVTDSVVGERVRGVDVKVIGPRGETQAFSDGDGAFSLGSIDAGEVTLRIAEEDFRYTTVEVTSDLPDGEVVTEQVSLEREDNIGNAV